MNVFTNDRSREDLDRDEMLTLATLYAVEFLGEAARSISPELRERQSEIPWVEIIGTRNRLAHGYADVDLIRTSNILEQTHNMQSFLKYSILYENRVIRTFRIRI